MLISYQRVTFPASYGSGFGDARMWLQDPLKACVVAAVALLAGGLIVTVGIFLLDLLIAEGLSEARRQRDQEGGELSNP